MNNIPKLYMMVGLPGSGKSTISEGVKKSSNREIIIHSSDKLREELYGDENNQENNGELFVELHKRIKEDLKRGKDVIYDATNINKKRRIAFLNELKNIECERYCALVLSTYEECIENNLKRDRVVPEEVIFKMLKNFQPPMKCEGFDKIILVFSNAVDNDIWNLQTLFDGDCGIDNFNQDNSHHKLTLGSHCKSACEYVYNAKPEDNRLKVAALLHDIGKIQTKTRLNTKGDFDGDYHYYQHHCVGAYNSFFYTYNLGFSEEDMVYIANIIYFHMHPYLEWKQSEKVMRKHMFMYGEDFYNDVMLIHEADVQAH